MVDLICGHCRAPFQRDGGIARKRKVSITFCSRDCHTAWKRSKMIRKCAVCRAPLFSNKKDCCSRKCKHIFARKNAFGVCLHCKIRFPSFPSTLKNGRKFCSVKCYRDYSVGENSPHWKGGKCLAHGNFWNHIRILVYERDKCCRGCDAITSPGGRRLDVHHIDPRRNYENQNDANIITNLVALCAPCHTRLEMRIKHGSVQLLPTRLKVLALAQESIARHPVAS